MKRDKNLSSYRSSYSTT